MNNLCCPCKCSCALVSVVASLVAGVIAAFLLITGVFTLTPTALVAVAAVAAAYLGALTLAAVLGRCDRARACCGSLNTLLVGLLGTVFLAALLLAVGITATSVISAILVGTFIGFVSLSLLVSACLVRCLTACGE